MSNQPKYRHGGPVPEDETTGAESTATSGTERFDSLRERVPVVGGLAAGVGAFLSTFIVVGATTFTGRSSVDTWGRIESPPSVLTETVWTLLMNLGAELQLGDEPVSTSNSLATYRLLNMSASPLYTILVFGIIVGAGYAVAECVRTDSPVERLVGSALIVPGYLVCSVALASISTWELPAEGDEFRTPSQAAEAREMSVAVTDAAIYAGILVPTVFALLGGLLAVGHRRWVTRRDPR